MSTDLVPFELDALPVVTDEELGAISDVKSGRAYLQRLQLAASSCDLCKTGKVMPGKWVIPTGDGECTVLGETADVLPIAVRNKAMDMTDKANIIASFDPECDEYKRIKAQKKRSYHGQSYLVIERKTGELLELYFGNASGREESDKLKPFLPRPGRPSQVATLGARFIEGKDYSWHAPTIKKCSEPFTSGPDVKLIIAEKEKFMNPKEAEVEVEEETKGKRAR